MVLLFGVKVSYFWLLHIKIITNAIHLVSVRLWNFKDGGSLKVRFLAKNQHNPKEKSLQNSEESYFIKNWRLI